jgi:plastocyanin
MRDRLALPVLLPVLAVGTILLTIFSFGYVLLQVQETREAWPVAIAVAAAILLIAAFINSQPSIRGLPLYALTALPASVVLAIGLFYLIRPAAEGPAGGPVSAVIQPPGPLQQIATDNRFSQTEYTIIAGQQYTLNFSNQGNALHNWAVKGVQGADGQPVQTQLLPGGQSETINFTINQPGTYQFICDVHPVEMVGELTVISAEQAAAAGGAAAGAGGGGGGNPGPGTIVSIATDNRFSPTQYNARANEQTTLTLENRGQQIHNWAVKGVQGTNGQPVQTRLLPGGQSETIQFTIAQPGTYNVICDVHPVEMTATLTVQ